MRHENAVEESQRPSETENMETIEPFAANTVEGTIHDIV